MMIIVIMILELFSNLTPSEKEKLENELKEIRLEIEKLRP